jgi:hypothetical protein
MRVREPWRARSVLFAAAILAIALSGCGEGEQGASEPTAAGSSTDAAVDEAALEEPAEPEPVIEHSQVEKRKAIPFASQTRKTSELKKGVSQVAQRGRDGVRLTVWRVTTTDGETTARKLVRTVIERSPVPRITLVGTYVAPPPPKPSCDPNYTGACVPISSDVDCGGGSGDGPGYVYGTVHVVGSDIYDLDADGDGWGCD